MRDLQIPDKSLFKLNEVCEITSVKPYVLRFWESEFEEIKPAVSSSGQKLYEHKDIELVAVIKKLLFEDKMSIEEARGEVQKIYSRLSEEGQDPVYLKEESSDLEFKSLDLNQAEIKKLDFAKGNLRRILDKANSLKRLYGEAVQS